MDAIIEFIIANESTNRFILAAIIGGVFALIGLLIGKIITRFYNKNWVLIISCLFCVLFTPITTNYIKVYTVKNYGDIFIINQAESIGLFATIFQEHPEEKEHFQNLLQEQFQESAFKNQEDLNQFLRSYSQSMTSFYLLKYIAFASNTKISELVNINYEMISKLQNTPQLCVEYELSSLSYLPDHIKSLAQKEIKIKEELIIEAIQSPFLSYELLDFNTILLQLETEYLKQKFDINNLFYLDVNIAKEDYQTACDSLVEFYKVLSVLDSNVYRSLTIHEM